MSLVKRTVGFILLALCCVVLFVCLNVAADTDCATCAASEQQDIIEILTTAKTAVWFTEEEVPEEHIRLILLAGLNAPSAVNVQPWHFSVVTNKEILNEIYEATIEALPAGYIEWLISLGPEIPETPPVIPRRIDLPDTPVAIFCLRHG